VCSFDEFDELMNRRAYSLDQTLASLGSVERSKIINMYTHASSLHFEVAYYVTDQLTTAERGSTDEDRSQSA